MLVRKPHLMIFWFLPLVIAMSTVRFVEIGLDGLIKYLQFGFVSLGLAFLIFNSKSIRLSISVLSILAILALNMLFSDANEYQLVMFLMGYALLVHMIAKKYPYEIWSQYYFVCLVVSWFAILDFLSFFMLGDFIISYRTPEVIGIGLPRINTIFDEMSHHAFFIMPAAIYGLVYNSKYRYLLLVSVLLTMSVSALVLFCVALLVYLRKRLLDNLARMTPLIVIVSLAFLLGSDFIIGKISGIFEYDNLISGQQTKGVSAENILLGFEILRNISLDELIIGYGYFGLAEHIPQLVYNSDLYPYFYFRDSLDDPKSFGILNLVLYFGLIQCSIIAFMLLRVRRYVNDSWLYMLAIFVVMLSLVYFSHTVEYLVNLFFVFGLSWACTHPTTKKTLHLKY